jgi:hypothetical protein
MIGDNWYIVGVNSREDASMEEFAKERDGIIQQKLSEKRGRVFSDYVGSLRREMEAKGDIKIYQDALAKLDEVSDTQTPQNQGIPPELQQQIQQQMEQQQKVPPPSQGN